MGKANRRVDTGHMMLRPEFLGTFPWDHPQLFRDAFRLWALKTRQPPINIRPHLWVPLKEGRAVRRVIVEAFCEYIGEKLEILPRSRCEVGKIAVPCDPPPPESRHGVPARRIAWESGWISIFQQMIYNLSITDESYCFDEADVAHAARIVMTSLSYYAGNRFPEPEAIAYAETRINRPIAEYTSDLIRYWKKNEHSIMFATVRRGSRIERVGVSIVVPVTDQYKARLYGGLADVNAIADDDVAARSMNVQFAGLSEDRAIDVRRDKAARAGAQILTLIYQLAAALSPVVNDGQPCIISFAGTEVNTRRLRAYGFKEIGVTTPNTRVSIMEFSEPKPPDNKLLARAQYQAMIALVKIHQQLMDTEAVIS